MARRRYTPKLKAQVVLEVLEGDKTPGQVAKAYGVHPNSVGLWKRRFIATAEASYGWTSWPRSPEGKLAERNT